MRRLALAVLALLTAVLACQVTTLELGPADPAVPIDAGADEAVVVADAAADAPTVEEQLRAKCNAPAGQSDTYKSASDLSKKITGRWYACTPPEVSPLYNDGIEFTAAHGWQRLLWADERHETFVPSPDPDMHGTLECRAFVDPDAGVGLDGGGGADPGSSTKPISCDDTTVRSRASLYVYLTSDQSHVLSFDLEVNPRRAYASEVGESSDMAVLVPIE